MVVVGKGRYTKKEDKTDEYYSFQEYIRKRTKILVYRFQKIRKKLLPLLIKKQGGCCYYCGSPLYSWKTIKGYQINSANATSVKNLCVIDHIISYSNGGDNYIGNLCLCCFSCNSSKGAKSAVEFKKYIKPVKDGLVRREDLREYNIYVQLSKKFSYCPKRKSILA